MVKFIYRFKSFIIFLCIVCFLPFSYLNTKRANADAISSVIALTTGGFISAEAIPILIAAAIPLVGYEVYEKYKDDFLNYIIANLGTDFIEAYCHIYQDSAGATYAGIDSAGLDELQNMLSNFSSSSAIVPEPISSTDNTISGTPQPYMLNGFYMNPILFKYINNFQTPYEKFTVKYGDTFYCQLSYNGVSKTNSFTPLGDTTVFIWQNSDTFFISYLTSTSFTNLLTWTLYNSNVYIDYGYYTTSKTVYVPASSTISGTGIDGSASDKVGSSVVAVPISGQYDSSKGDIVYAPIDGSTNATLVDGLNVKTSTQTGTGTGTDASYWSQLWDWLRQILDGVKSIPEALEGLPADIASAIGTLLQSLFVPTSADFTDFYDDIQNDVQVKFPYSLSILNSLKVGADEFTDIHVNIWGHDCVIVSAQFVNNNISWIRVVTSCFWLFALVVYIWRKINSVLGGNDVNSTTVYAPNNGGGSGPPSVF